MAGVEQVAEQLSPEDEIWNEYMGRKRGVSELTCLAISPDIAPPFQHRAIQVLLAPDIRKLPFPANIDYSSPNLTWARKEWLGSITDEQARYIAKILPEWIGETRKDVKYYARSSVFNSHAQYNLLTYHDVVITLLPRLPEEQSEVLFEDFANDDPMYSDSGISSAHPLRQLLLSDTEESWKRKGITRMHKSIEEEQAHLDPYRAYWEGAAARYRNILSSVLFAKELPISRELFQEEIEYMLGIKTGDPIIDLSRTGEALDLLQGEEVRYSFARRQVLSGERSAFGRFNIINDKDLATTEKIVDEFPYGHSLRFYLAREVEEYLVKTSGKRLEQEQAAQKDAEIFNQMKRPT